VPVPSVLAISSSDEILEAWARCATGHEPYVRWLSA
jgi:hypothetical protein